MPLMARFVAPTSVHMFCNRLIPNCIDIISTIYKDNGQLPMFKLTNKAGFVSVKLSYVEA